MDIIEAARAGDPLALERVLWYYDRYINKICTRTLYDKDGLLHLFYNLSCLVFSIQLYINGIIKK